MENKWIQVQVPAEVHASLVKQAKSDERSLAQYIRKILAKQASKKAVS